MISKAGSATYTDDRLARVLADAWGMEVVPLRELLRQAGSECAVCSGSGVTMGLKDTVVHSQAFDSVYRVINTHDPALEVCMLESERGTPHMVTDGRRLEAGLIFFVYRLTTSAVPVWMDALGRTASVRAAPQKRHGAPLMSCRRHRDGEWYLAFNASFLSPR